MTIEQFSNLKFEEKNNGPYYNYQDSLKQFMAGNELDRLYLEVGNAQRYNKYNHRLKGLNYMTIARESYLYLKNLKHPNLFMPYRCFLYFFECYIEQCLCDCEKTI